MIGGSLLMAAGAVAIACSSASESEYSSWKEAAQCEIDLYGIDPEYVMTRMEGSESSAAMLLVLLAGGVALWRITKFRQPS